MPEPDPPPTDAALGADETARRELRFVGVFYYLLGVSSLASAVLLAAYLPELGSDLTTAAFVPSGVFLWLGFGLRRFWPAAGTLATLIALILLIAPPFGTLIGLFTLDRLNKADHLFRR